jgi:hypothetical protein
MIAPIPQFNFNFDFYSDSRYRESAALSMPTTLSPQQNWQSPSSSNPSNIKFNFQFALPSIQSLSATSNTQQSPTTNTGSTNSSTGSTSSSNGSSSQSFTKSFGDFLAAARNAGMSYARTDPSFSHGMDCVTSLWGFMKNYLTPEDFAKLAPLKERAYVNEGTLEQRIGGFAGAVADAGLGKSVKVDKAYLDSLVKKGNAAVKEALVGSIYTYSGSEGGHVSVISDAWIENGTIKYKIIGAHREGNSIEDGNKSGLGTHKKIFDLTDDTKPGEHLTLTQLNSDVVNRAEVANDPKKRNTISTGDTVFKEVRGLLSSVLGVA